MTAPTSIKEISSPPVSPSGSIGHNDLTASPHHRRKAVSSLSLGALSPLLRSVSPPPSLARTPSPRYLSPPISIASIASPPPRPEADDYLAAGARHAGGKGKHHSRQQYSSHSHLIRSDVSQVSVGPSNTTPPPARLVEAAKIGSAGTAGSNEDDTSLAAPPVSLITVQPKDRRSGWQPRNSIECLPPDVKATFLPAPLDVPDDAGSAAVSALQRLSRTHTQPRDTGFLDIHRFSRALTGNLSRVFTFKNAPPGVGMVNESAEFLAATGAHSADIEYGTGHRDQLTFNEDGLSEVRVTPAIIILRKASAACQPRPTTTPNTTSASFERSRAFESPFHPHTSTVSLLAFDSKPIEKESPSISATLSPLKENDQDSAEPNTPVRSPSLISDYLLPRKKTRSMTLLGNTAVNRRHSVAAEAALTTTEFFPCPGTLISPCSKPDLLGPEQAPARTSVVQFASRNSVHKIIWQENETSSSGSSSSPVSPTYKETPSPIKMSSEFIDQASLAILNAETQTAPGNTSPSSLENSVLLSSAQREAKEAQDAQNPFSAWSWDSSLPPVMESNVSLHGAQLRNSKFQASTFDGVVVESFPPLDDHRSTSEWRKKPLVDPHDPVAGREDPQPHVISDREEGEFGSYIKREQQRSRTSPNVLEIDTKAEKGSKTEKGSRISSLSGLLFTPARVGGEGRTGRSVAVGPHMRAQAGK